jgi:hypothetical protein
LLRNGPIDQLLTLVSEKFQIMKVTHSQLVARTRSVEQDLGVGSGDHMEDSDNWCGVDSSRGRAQYSTYLTWLYVFEWPKVAKLDRLIRFQGLFCLVGSMLARQIRQVKIGFSPTRPA